MGKASDEAVLIFCRLGAAGLAPRAPGTWGSALAAVFAPIYFLPLSPGNRALALAAVFVLGGLAAGRAEKILGRKDPSQVVIDELLGMWTAIAFFTAPPLELVLAAFALFRLLDITKPWPVKASEKWLPGGFGIMIDDLLAGLMAAALLAAGMRFL